MGLSAGRKGIIVFPTTYETLKAEKVLKSEGLYVRPVPKPSWISSSCGLALEFSLEDREDMLSICRRSGLAITGIYSWGD